MSIGGGISDPNRWTVKNLDLYSVSEIEESSLHLSAMLCVKLNGIRDASFEHQSCLLSHFGRFNASVTLRTFQIFADFSSFFRFLYVN